MTESYIWFVDPLHQDFNGATGIFKPTKTRLDYFRIVDDKNVRRSDELNDVAKEHVRLLFSANDHQAATCSLWSGSLGN